ncbi:MAG: DUF192 domain-containing protein [Dehalococcoidia bacterium]
MSIGTFRTRPALRAGPALPGLLMAALAGALLLACGGKEIEQGPTPTPVLPVTTVRIGDDVILAEVPQAPQDRARGLGERDFLPRDRGMLFVFDFEHPHAFWMRGMRFPLDFVWISADRRVVEVTTEVPPEPGVPEAELQLYRPRAAVLYMLEVNSGVVEELGIRVGDRVEFTLP